MKCLGSDSSGLYDPLKVDVWSLGATTWELVHGDPPFADVQDTRRIVGTQLPPVRQPVALSRSFHDFLHLCSQPAASRPDPDELLNVRFSPLTPIPPTPARFASFFLALITGLFLFCAGSVCTDCVLTLRDCPAAGTV